METFRATIRREGKWWIATVSDLPGKGSGVTQGRTWTEVCDMAADLVAILLEIPIESVHIEPVLDNPQAQAAWGQARRTRAAAQKASMDAEEALVKAAKILTGMSTVRDAGAILGYSHQHIAKLVPQRSEATKNWADLLREEIFRKGGIWTDRQAALYLRSIGLGCTVETARARMSEIAEQEPDRMAMVEGQRWTWNVT